MQATNPSSVTLTKTIKLMNSEPEIFTKGGFDFTSELVVTQEMLDEAKRLFLDDNDLEEDELELEDREVVQELWQELCFILSRKAAQVISDRHGFGIEHHPNYYDHTSNYRFSYAIKTGEFAGLYFAMGACEHADHVESADKFVGTTVPVVVREFEWEGQNRWLSTWNGEEIPEGAEFRIEAV